MRQGVRISVGVRMTLLALGVATPLFAEPAPPSTPPTREACFASHGRSQELRIDGKLLEARTELRVCSDAACPGMLRSDCTSWLAEVEQQVPSVTLSAVVEGSEAADVRVGVDGRVLTQTLDGSAYELNPGAHTFRFEVPGYPPREEVVVLRQYEKRRVVRAEFRKAAEVVTPPPAPSLPPGSAGPAAPTGPRKRPVPVAAWMLGGVALGAAAASVYLGVDALSEHSDKEDSCSPNCADSDVRKLKSQLLLADIAGGAAVVSAGIAVYLYLTRPEVIEQRPMGFSNRVRISAAPGGAALLVNGAF